MENPRTAVLQHRPGGMDMDDVLQLLLNDYDQERPIDSRQVPCRPEPVMVRQLLEKLQMLLFPR